MAVKIDWNEILKEATKAIVQEAQGTVDDYVLGGGSSGGNVGSAPQSILTEAADKLIECLQFQIEHSDYLGPTAIEALTSLEKTAPEKIGNNKYSITVYFTTGGRPSLQPEEYDGIDDLASLLDKGYEVKGKPGIVFGYWHDRMIASRRCFGGANYIDDGVLAFKIMYKQIYNIEDITVRRYSDIDRF